MYFSFIGACSRQNLMQEIRWKTCGLQYPLQDCCSSNSQRSAYSVPFLCVHNCSFNPCIPDLSLNFNLDPMVTGPMQPNANNVFEHPVLYLAIQLLFKPFTLPLINRQWQEKKRSPFEGGPRASSKPKDHQVPNSKTQSAYFHEAGSSTQSLQCTSPWLVDGESWFFMHGKCDKY